MPSHDTLERVFAALDPVTFQKCLVDWIGRLHEVTRGQVIARVGATGNVGEPQLHFELRRGNRPVDPRELLAPLPSADTRTGGTG